jgi:hypothetical protein
MEKTFSQTIGGLILTLVASASIATFASLLFTSRISSDFKVTSSRLLLSGGIFVQTNNFVHVKIQKL